MRSTEDELREMRIKEERLERALARLDEWYPDGDISRLRTEHSHYVDNLTILAHDMGFEGWRELLRANGYEPGEARSGRPVTANPDEVIAELKRRYEGRVAPRTITGLREDNPDLSGKIKTLQNKLGKEPGDSLLQRLRASGVWDGSGRAVGWDTAGGARVGDQREADALAFMDELKALYIDADERPWSVGRLEALHPDHKADFAFLKKESARLFGTTFAKYLKKIGVVSGGAGSRPAGSRAPAARDESMTAEELDGILAACRDRLTRKPRKSSYREFLAANPEFKARKVAIGYYLDSLGTTPAKFVEKEGLISKVVREDSAPRPGSDELAAWEAKVGRVGEEELRERAKARGCGLVSIETSVTGSEDYDNPRFFDMLRHGDSLELELIEGQWVRVLFCGHALGLIDWHTRVDNKLDQLMRDPEAHGVVDGKLNCVVTGIGGGPIKPRCEFTLYYAVEDAGRNVVGGLLLSKDGKTVVDCLETLFELVVPEGVEAIPAHLFAKKPIERVELPSTLKSIGDFAFDLTCIKEVVIPASVESIGVGAFSHCEPYELEGTYPHADGPVRIKVESGCAHYRSENGSLIEDDERGGRLLSLYYEQTTPRSGSMFDATAKPTFPEGVDCLASYCVVPGKYGPKFDLVLPETLTTIEEGAVPNASVRSLRIPRALMHVSHDFWRYVAGDYPDLWENFTVQDATGVHVTKGPHIPKDELVVSDRVTLEVDPENPCFRLDGGVFHILYRDGDSAGDIEPLARPSESDITECKDALIPDAAAVAGAREVAFDLMLRPGEDERAAAKSLEVGDVLELVTTPRDDAARLLFCGQPVGRVRLKANRLDYPFDFLVEDELGLDEKPERYSFTHEVGGKKVSYSFDFYRACDIEWEHEQEVRFYLKSPSASSFVLHRRYKSHMGGPEFERTRPKLCEVVRGYEGFGGAASPYATVKALVGPEGHKAPEVTLHFFFSGNEAER